MIDPGRLTRQVVVEELTVTDDGAGNWSSTWANRGTVWAEIVPLQGSELFRAQAVQPNLTHRVTLRFWPGLTAGHRLRFGDRVFHITGPPIGEPLTELSVVYCTEQPPEG
jgi:SPP1 family predicted phage head-tail adaptor